jgi:hypothetical protein
LFAEGKAGIANLTDETGAVGDKTDHLIFAEAQFAQTVLELRFGAQLTDAHSHPGLHAGEWTKFAAFIRTAPRICRTTSIHVGLSLKPRGSASHTEVVLPFAKIALLPSALRILRLP